MPVSTKNIIIDDADKPNAGANAPRRYDTVTQRRPVNVRAWLAVALAAFVVLGCGGVAVWSFAAYKYQSDARFAALVDGSAFVLVVAVVATFGALLWSVSAGAVRASRRAGFVEWPGGATVDARAVRGLQAPQLMQMYAAHMGVEGRYADNSQFQRVTNFSGQLGAAPARGEIVESTAVPALPDSTAALIVPDTDWLRWIDRTPHLLIAGRTEAGKTTLAEAILAERIQSGDELLIFDPHYQPGKWHNLPAIGGGRDFDGILSMLPILIGELDDRYKRFNDGMKTEQFRRLTILLDEVPAIIGETYETTPSGGKRIIDDRWLRFAKRLGSEARKVRMSVILLSQSTLVDDLLINTAHRENFIRIGLGDKARALLSEEKDTKRRQAGYDLLRGQAHPAAMEYRSDYHVLNTERVPDLAQRAVGHLATIWEAPTPAEPPRLAQRAVAKAQAPTVARASVAVAPLDIYKGMTFADDAARIGWLAFHTKLGTREIREIVGCNYNDVVAVAGDVRRRKALKEAKAR